MQRSLDKINVSAAARNENTKLLPKCPRCGKPLTLNLRSDGGFVEDADWHTAGCLEDIAERSILINGNKFYVFTGC